MSKNLPSGPVIMGILNVTPDSFSDGGKFINPAKAVDHALKLIEEGADIIDIGGESTRPGADSVSPAEEIDRILPVIEKLKGCGALISVDTYHARTMKEALAAGAGMINDITALRGDPESLSVAAQSDALICLMHMQGDSPRTMQDNPVYNNVVEEVSEFLHQRIAICETAGIDRARLLIDPGIGFGKAFDHNISLLRGIAEIGRAGPPILIGASRKGFIEKICPGALPDQRVSGSVAVALWALAQGVKVFRVHDVAATKQAFAVHQAICAMA